MAEYQTNYDISTGVTRVKHFSQRIIGGAARTIVQRTADALADLNFRVIERTETSIRAERLSLNPPARGKIFRVPTEIFVTFRELSENLTEVHYEYLLTDAAMFRADHEIVEREIDALAALAEQFRRAGFCANCAAEFSEKSPNQKFCPSCGAERLTKSPPEVELLYIVAAAKRGQRATFAGAAVIFSSIALFFALLLIVGAPLAGLPVLLFGALQITGWLVLASGVRSTQKALLPVPNKSSEPEKLLLTGNHQSPKTLDPAAPAVLTTPLSVTEDSTRNLSMPTKDL